MKILSLALLLTASLAFVLLGCSDNSAPVVASTDVQHNASASLMKTSGPGAWIERYDMIYYVFWFVDENGLLVTFGVNDKEMYCARTGGKDVFSYKDIFLPDADPDLRRVIEKMNGTDVTAMAFQVVLDPASDLRGYICGIEPIATGTANFKSTDNDVLAYVPDPPRPNSNAFGYHGNGTLEGPDGQKFLLNLVYRFVWDPGTPRYNEVFKLQLTPAGGK